MLKFFRFPLALLIALALGFALAPLRSDATVQATAGIGMAKAGPTTYFTAGCTASTAATIQTAASNVSGIIIWEGRMAAGAAAQFMELTIGTTAPTTSLSNPMIYGVNINTVAAEVFTFPYPILVPAGQGLFTWCGATGGAVAQLAYQVL